MMPFRPRLLKNTLIIAGFFSLVAYGAEKSNWILWRQTTSSIMNTDKKTVAAFDTQAKCEKELEKAVSTNAAQLKAERVQNSVVYSSGKITYSCLPEVAVKNKAFSKSLQNNYKRKSNSPSNKQNLY